jgi:hypothetical protein
MCGLEPFGPVDGAVCESVDVFDVSEFVVFVRAEVQWDELDYERE